MKENRFFKLDTLFAITMVLIMVSVSVLLMWRVETEIEQHDQYQQLMIQKQAEVAASEVEELIKSIRDRMVAISMDNFFLKDFESFKTLDSLQEALHDRFQNYFPEMYAFTIANQQGELMGGDVDLFISDICRADLQATAGKLNKRLPFNDYKPWIHPKPEAYHFDMMFPTKALGQTVVFFMSFKAELLQEAINRKTFTEHPVYLLRKDAPGLIEVTQLGVRNVLNRDLYLSEKELKQAQARVDVKGTRWEIAVLPKESIRTAFANKAYLDAGGMFISFFVFWLALLMFGLYEERKKGRLLKHLHHLSSHDTLTDLANRRKLYQAFSHSQSHRRFDGEYCGVLYLDLNQFKPVNDQYGHEVGDELLKLVSKRLLACSRESDVVARIGGDEFVVLLNDLGQAETEAQKNLVEAEQRFVEHLSPEYSIQDLRLNVTASIGAALLSSKDDSMDALLKEADQKMYQFKQQSREQWV